MAVAAVVAAAAVGGTVVVVAGVAPNGYASHRYKPHEEIGNINEHSGAAA